jgi:hypothetical protein
MASLIQKYADIAALIARTVEATAGPVGVRFCVISSVPGMGVETCAKAVAEAIGMGVLDLRLPQMIKGDFEEGTPIREAARNTLEGMGDAFILCSEAGFEASSPKRTGSSTARPALAEVVDFLQGQDVDRDDVRRSRVVLLTTHGPAADLIEVVREVTGRGPAGFLVLE